MARGRNAVFHTMNEVVGASEAKVQSIGAHTGIAGAIVKWGVAAGGKLGFVSETTIARIEEFNKVVELARMSLHPDERKALDHAAVAGPVGGAVIGGVKMGAKAATAGIPFLSGLLVKPLKSLLNSFRADKVANIANALDDRSDGYMERAYAQMLRTEAESIKGNEGEGLRGAIRQLPLGLGHKLLKAYDGESTSKEAANAVMHLASLGIELNPQRRHNKVSQPSKKRMIHNRIKLDKLRAERTAARQARQKDE